MALLLARVASHRRLDAIGLAADVDQEIRVEKVVDLIGEDLEIADERPQLVVFSKSPEKIVDRGEGRSMIGAGLEGRGHQQQLGAERQQRFSHPFGDLFAVLLEAPVR